MAQRGVGVLFDQENRGSLALNFVDGFEDGMDHERRETERWFVEQQQSLMSNPRLLLLDEPSSGARPSDGSSSSSSRGFDISARPIASICCSPPESVPAFCDSRSRSRGRLEHSPAASVPAFCDSRSRSRGNILNARSMSAAISEG